MVKMLNIRGMILIQMDILVASVIPVRLSRLVSIGSRVSTGILDLLVCLAKQVSLGIHASIVRSGNLVSRICLGLGRGLA